MIFATISDINESNENIKKMKYKSIKKMLNLVRSVCIFDSFTYC